MKYGSISQNANAARQQSKQSDPQDKDHPVDNESTLSRFARQNFCVELAIDSSDSTKASSSRSRSSGRDSFSRRGNTKSLDCYGMDIAPMNILKIRIIL